MSRCRRRRCSPFWLSFRYIPNNSVGVVEKLWSLERLGARRPDHRARRRGRLPGRAAPRRHPLRLLALAVPRPQGAAGDDSAGQDRLRLRPRRRAAAAEPDARPRVACNNFQDARAFLVGIDDEDGDSVARPARPPAGDPARRRLRHQPGRCSSSSPKTMCSRCRRSNRGRSCKTIEQYRDELAAIGGFDPVVIGAKIARRSTPTIPSKPTMVDSIGIVTVHDGPSLPPGEIIAPAVGSDARRAELPQQLPGPRGVSARRRPPRPAVPAAHRRHLLHQPLVRHGRDDSQDRRADRLRRRGRQLLRPARPRPLRQGVPPRRARRRGRARRVGEAARPGQVCVQHLRRQHHPGADDELRAALDHRQERDRTATTKACGRSTW